MSAPGFVSETGARHHATATPVGHHPAFADRALEHRKGASDRQDAATMNPMTNSAVGTSLVPATHSGTADPICAAAVDDAAKAVLAEAGPEAVGAHLGLIAEDERVVSHRFACTLPGYPGWEWHVAITRAKRSRTVSVNEVTLAPGPESLLPPPWVPWADRLEPGDLTPGTVVPTPADEARLAPGWSGEEELTGPLDPGPLHPVNWEPGLQRTRVPSSFGRESAASRWHAGEHGPRSPLAKAAPGPCSSCGWMLTIGGPLGQLFGICTNMLSPSDGRVVSFDHGCGGHSEASPTNVRIERTAAVVDDLVIDELDMGHS